MDYIEYLDDFAHFEDDPTSRVFQIHPNVYRDERGSFTEVLKDHQYGISNMPIWFSNSSWIKQINRSVSAPNVCRGLHAQSGKFCQGKLVECVKGLIVDIIVDARPNSSTFGMCKLIPLIDSLANKLYVPRGFLHGFYSADVDADGKQVTTNIFQYYISHSAYNKNSEISVNIEDIWSQVSNILKTPEFAHLNDTPDVPLFQHLDAIVLSEKDKNGLKYDEWLQNVRTMYEEKNILWYL